MYLRDGRKTTTFKGLYFYNIYSLPIINNFIYLYFLFQLNVAAIFILVAIDEGPGGSNIKYQFNEINKLHSVISILVRCCDCTEKCVSFAPVSIYIILFLYLQFNALVDRIVKTCVTVFEVPDLTPKWQMRLPT